MVGVRAGSLEPLCLTIGRACTVRSTYWSNTDDGSGQLVEDPTFAGGLAEVGVELFEDADNGAWRTVDLNRDGATDLLIVALDGSASFRSDPAVDASKEGRGIKQVATILGGAREHTPPPTGGDGLRGAGRDPQPSRRWGARSGGVALAELAALRARLGESTK